MHVLTVGGGPNVPLLLLHMSPLSDAWEGVLPMLANGRTVVVPDRLGFGDSDRLAEPIPFPEYARATLCALDQLGLDRVDIVGIHTGSCEAVELAVRHPERVRRLAIVSTPAFTDDERHAFKKT